MFSAIRGVWGRGRDEVLDALLPQTCLVCENPHDDPPPLCEACQLKLDELTQAERCGRCGMPVPDPEQPCGWCRGAGVRPFEQIVRLTTYDEPVTTIVRQLKFGGRWQAGAMLARRLRAQPEAMALLEQADIVVPVPLHVRRHWWRGYNQAEVIARALARSKCRRALVRIKATDAQSLQDSRRSRSQNLRDAFVMPNPKLVRDLHVLLVDDVMTTGATLRSAARALRLGRPRRLSAIVLAVADPHGRSFMDLDPF